MGRPKIGRGELSGDLEMSPGVPELALWRAVIERAIRDALGGGTGEENEAQRRLYTTTARNWIRGDRDFELVCDFADLDPVAVAETVEILIDRGLSPRSFRL